MSRRVLNAHTGESLSTDTAASETFAGLKLWIADKTGISDARQVLMTSRGKPVKLQTLRTEEDIFVYDRDLISGSTGGLTRSLAEHGYPTAYDTPQIPRGPSEGAGTQAWLAGAEDRAAWAEDVGQACADLASHGKRLSTEAAVVQQATAIAVERLKQHIGGLRQRYKQANEWVTGLRADQQTFRQEQDSLRKRLSAVPVSADLQKYLRQGNSDAASASTLLSLVGTKDLDTVARQAEEVSARIAGVLDDLHGACEGVFDDGDNLVAAFAADFTSSTGELLEALDGHTEEQGVLCKKIHDDCNGIARGTAKDASQFPKTFAKHEKNLVPPLSEAVAGIQDTIHAIFDYKTQISSTALEYLQKVSAVESSIGQVTQHFGRLDLDEQDDATLDRLDIIYRLPDIYGSLLLEVVRRREWTEKMTSDSTSLAEEMATFKDEEERRRKKWLKSIDQYLTADIAPDAMGIDISVRSSEEDWPPLTRDDAAKYIKQLKKVGGFEETVDELLNTLGAMDVPSKQQSKRASAFRKGSVHEATFGRNSLLMRGDDDLIRSLQQDNTRLQERLKGSDSRVRKLEDLLHRQSQIQSRPSSRGVAAHYPLDRHISAPGVTEGTGFSKVPIHPQSPGAHASRTSSLVAQIHEQNPLAERVAQLEAELNAEKTQNTKMQESTARHAEAEEALRAKMQEAASTKNDLLENFQAQQNEFDGERRLLEDENRKLKVRIEELEEDFDRILGSHDNARLGLDERTKAFEQELRNHRERAAEELERVSKERDKVQNEYTQLDRDLAELQRQLSDTELRQSNAETRVRELEQAATLRDEAEAEHLRALRATHLQLANANEPMPRDFESVVEGVETLSRKVASHLQDIQQALDKARSETTWQEKQLSSKDAEVNKLKARVDAEELEVFSLREEIADRKARYSSLEAELEDQRQDLEALRSKNADGENASQSLRDQLNQDAAKIKILEGDLREAEGVRAQNEAELVRVAERLNIVEKARNEQQALLDARAKRAEEVSTRLYHQHSFLLRLLTQVGYTATQNNGRYSFERTSRLSNSSSVIESSPAASRTASGNIPLSQDNQPLPRHVQWASSDNPGREEEIYQEYLEDVNSLQIDLVVETLTKRFKDVEHIARKWQREAKNYREKFHKTQFEAQNKIAYRGFKEGDLALFLPTRNQAPRRSWAAFNVGAPHYFLREQENHTLNNRDWLVARISKVEDRVVDLSKAPSPVAEAGRDVNDKGGASVDEENPFGLSDGLRWYYLDAAEERFGAAPSTPGLGKSTVASTNENAAGSNALNKKKPGEAAAAKVLTKSLDSRRSSTNSKKSTAGAMASPANATGTFDVGHGEMSGAAAAIGAVAGDRSSIRTAASRESGPQESHAGASPGQQADDVSARPVAERPTSPRKSKAWNSLWSMDLHLESGRKGEGR